MLSAPCAVVIVNGVSRQIEDKMYYWLKDPGCYGVYVTMMIQTRFIMYVMADLLKLNLRNILSSSLSLT